MTEDALGRDFVPRAPATGGVRVQPVPESGGIDAAVEVRRLTKSFSRARNAVPVLQEIDLTVAAGEFVCLIGASGCGKSTLLSLIAGLDASTGGDVRVTGGRPALMFQEAALFPWLSARRNVELALRLRGLPRRQRREEAERLLALVRLAGAGERRVHELSGGMQQRVALARALAQRSQVLLMDEPFAALDAITRSVLHDELLRVWGAMRLSIVFVTHNVREAVHLGQRVVLLSSRPGRIVHEWHLEGGAVGKAPSARAKEIEEEITEHLRDEISRHAASASVVAEVRRRWI